MGKRSDWKQWTKGKWGHGVRLSKPKRKRLKLCKRKGKRVKVKTKKTAPKVYNLTQRTPQPTRARSAQISPAAAKALGVSWLFGEGE